MRGIDGGGHLRPRQLLLGADHAAGIAGRSQHRGLEQITQLASLDAASTATASEHGGVPDPGHHRREHAVAKQLALEPRVKPPEQPRAP